MPGPYPTQISSKFGLAWKFSSDTASFLAQISSLLTYPWRGGPGHYNFVFKLLFSFIYLTFINPLLALLQVSLQVPRIASQWKYSKEIQIFILFIHINPLRALCSLCIFHIYCTCIICLSSPQLKNKLSQDQKSCEFWVVLIPSLQNNLNPYLESIGFIDIFVNNQLVF